MIKARVFMPIKHKGSTDVAVCDFTDWLRVKNYKWHINKTASSKYACRTVWLGIRNNPKKISQLMHRFILGKCGDLQIDHIDGNGLNNTKKNIRFVTRAQNQANSMKHVKGTSIYKGVFFDKKRNKWRAAIAKESKFKFIGYYKSEAEAALAYNKKATEVFGEYAKLNVIEPEVDYRGRN